MSDQGDRELIARIAKKDATAVQALFTSHQTRIFRFTMRLVRNEAVAEELCNEVFLEVWRKAGTYKGQSAVTTWLLSIARNKAISQLRKRSESELDEEHAAAVPDDQDTPDVEYAKQNKAEIMRRCIDQLSPAHKEIIDLVYYQEKAVNEVSEILDVPPATVKTRMFYARKQLTESFRAAGIERGWP
jgi:RNA polymerase sigma-70 factor (ECF subfamily)